MKLLATIVLSLSFALAHSQTFKKWESERFNLTYIRYYDENTQIIIQKTIHTDSALQQTQKIEIGLIVYKFTIPYDLFMSDESIVFFDDASFLVIPGQIVVGYLQAGKHQLTIRYELNDKQLSLFKSKKIKYFSIAGVEKTLDKWQKTDCQLAFQKIDTEL